MLVVGGGINGAGIARDLSGRGLKVLLTEKDDLAAHTSSSSTKLIHGGLRYLEYYEFAMVRKSLAEREVLLNSAPHIMWPLRFVMPHDASAKSARPVWMIRIGLFLYDHLAKRELLAGSTTVDLRTHAAGQPLKPLFTKGFVYSDGWVDDARLVVLNAIDAREHGASVLTGWRCVDAQRSAAQWQVQLESTTGERRSVTARALVNAAGPWAAQFLGEHAHLPQSKTLRLVKGSHIVVKKLFEHDHAYIFQNPDKRIIFAIPYEGDFTLIGTTDADHEPGDPIEASSQEIAYLCAGASEYFREPVTPDDVVWSYAGVRPLVDDGSGKPETASRGYRFDINTDADGGAPLLSVFGGKITTYRHLAESAVAQLRQWLPQLDGASWTATKPLPGGDFPVRDAAVVGDALRSDYPFLDAFTAKRLARCYGTRAYAWLGDAQSWVDLGDAFGHGLTSAEVDYLTGQEWARTTDDILWRRSKLGLRFDPKQTTELANYLTHK